MIKKIAIYGKGGIGKSTTVANLSAVYANNDLNCLVIGCDPKADTTRTLCGRRIPTVVDTLKNNRKPSEEDIIVKGYNDILCVESGGPEPGVGCAGRGVIVAMKRLENLGVFDKDLDVVIYDVLGDVVCGGFAAPIREGYAEKVLIVTSGEKMALYAANNISSAVRNFEDRSYARIFGIVLNHRNVENETEKVQAFAEKSHIPIVGEIPRSDEIIRYEDQGKTVIEGDRDSEISQRFFDLANLLLEDEAKKAQDGE